MKLLELELEPKEASRGAHALLYFKKADQISDFLARVGAQVSSMHIITAKVEKEMRNTVTRQINCDSANADKTVSAAIRQNEAIRKVLKRDGMDALPEPLRDAALLRLANPEASLSDLALLSNPPPASAGGGVKGILRQNRFMALNPMMRGSSVKTLVLSRESSLLVKKSVIGASLNRFLT